MKPSASHDCPSGTGAELRLRVDRIDDAPDRIAEQRLLDQADRDEGDAERELALPARRINLPAELVHHLAPARERPAIACGKNAM